VARLRGWLDDEREILIGREHFEHDLKDWQRTAEGQKTETLLTGLKLARAQEWLFARPRHFSQAERQFIQASEKYSLTKARQRRVTIWTNAALAFLVVAILSYLALAAIEQNLNRVTGRLSALTARDMAAIAELYEAGTTIENISRLPHIGRNGFGLSVSALPVGDLPEPAPKPYFDMRGRVFSDQIRATVKRPFWIESIGQSRYFEIRVKLRNGALRFITLHAEPYYLPIYLTWMMCTLAIVLAVGYVTFRQLFRPSR
jgi:hypothetical protein